MSRQGAAQGDAYHLDRLALKRHSDFPPRPVIPDRRQPGETAEQARKELRRGQRGGAIVIPEVMRCTDRRLWLDAGTKPGGGGCVTCSSNPHCRLLSSGGARPELADVGCGARGEAGADGLEDALWQDGEPGFGHPAFVNREERSIGAGLGDDQRGEVGDQSFSGDRTLVVAVLKPGAGKPDGLAGPHSMHVLEAEAWAAFQEAQLRRLNLGHILVQQEQHRCHRPF